MIVVIIVICVICLIYFTAARVLPFPNATSFKTAFVSTLWFPGLPLSQRIGMLCYLARDLLLLPVWALFWVTDELLFSAYHKQQIEKPIFLFAQPRSGTTFLLRTLAADDNTFLSVKHLEWRYPYISFWKLVAMLGLTKRLEAKSYWPDTEIGRRCSKIHHHLLGNHEEFGIFLEERFYHHYFVFRRFPFPAVLDRVAAFDSLTAPEKRQLLDTFIKVVKKVYFHRGRGEIFLTKENECIDLCRALIDKFDDPRIIMMCRQPQPMLDSYLTMSINCTAVKHGVDPTRLPGWHETNIDFRRVQCRRFIAFAADLKNSPTNAALISFDTLTADIKGTIKALYRQFRIPLSAAFAARLQALQQHQRTRNKGYSNLTCSEPDFEFYAAFVDAATSKGPSH